VKVKALFDFILEREAVRVKKERGDAKPWTKDPILQRYRFCNVHRENDKVTIWIRENWREPSADNPDLWFSMVVARLLNKPESLGFLGWPLPWNPKRFKKLMRERKEAGLKIFSAAYMIHADAVETGLKTDYLADFVLAPMWKERAELRPRKGDTLAQFHARIMTQRDMGSFMAAQVVADTKFTPPLDKATDWWTWAAPGPGSMKGMNYVLGLPASAKHPNGVWEANLKVLQTQIDPLTREANMQRISAQDLQNCLCEFSKHERARLGEGRPKQLYPGAA
jgi:hypothetical protein